MLNHYFKNKQNVELLRITLKVSLVVEHLGFVNYLCEIWCFSYEQTKNPCHLCYVLVCMYLVH